MIRQNVNMATNAILYCGLDSFDSKILESFGGIDDRFGDKFMQRYRFGGEILGRF